MSPFQASLARRFVAKAGVAALGAAMILGLASGGGGDEKPAAGTMPSELTFSILSAEGQASSGPLWQPLLDDMSKAVGVPVKPFFAGNYNVLIEAMRFNQTQVAWFSAKPALEAVDRAQGEVIARIVDPEGRDSYTSTLIVRKGSGVTLDKVTRHLKENFPDVTEVKSAVIWLKGCSVVRPDYFLDELPHNPWIHQPFEDYDGLRPHQLAAWMKKFEK